MQLAKQGRRLAAWLDTVFEARWEDCGRVYTTSSLDHRLFTGWQPWHWCGILAKGPSRKPTSPN